MNKYRAYEWQMLSALSFLAIVSRITDGSAVAERYCYIDAPGVKDLTISPPSVKADLLFFRSFLLLLAPGVMGLLALPGPFRLVSVAISVLIGGGTAFATALNG